jgi:NAD-dependent deacetylase
MNDKLEQAAAILRSAKYAIAVTGAGASVESGIPSFRGNSGLWVKYPPEEYATIDGFMNDPDKVWRLWYELGYMMKDCRPNPGHTALAELESMGLLAGIITQNIDNLHQEAGSREVVEYHGNARRMSCLDCGVVAPLNLTRPDPPRDAPSCKICGGLMKPDIVMFGELIPEAALIRSDELVSACDAMIIVGTSAQVYPAAGLPRIAKSRGAKIIEVNVEPTDFSTSVTDVLLQGPSGQILPELVAALRG